MSRTVRQQEVHKELGKQHQPFRNPSPQTTAEETTTGDVTLSHSGLKKKL